LPTAIHTHTEFAILVNLRPIHKTFVLAVADCVTIVTAKFLVVGVFEPFDSMSQRILRLLINTNDFTIFLEQVKTSQTNIVTSVQPRILFECSWTSPTLCIYRCCCSRAWSTIGFWRIGQILPLPCTIVVISVDSSHAHAQVGNGTTPNAASTQAAFLFAQCVQKVLGCAGFAKWGRILDSFLVMLVTIFCDP
jgi:hypothetical protein